MLEIRSKKLICTFNIFSILLESVREQYLRFLHVFDASRINEGIAKAFKRKML